MNLVYLGVLLVSLAGMVVLDLRFRLFFAVAPLRAAVVLAAGIVFFLAWDLAGIGAGVFFRGNPGLLTGVLIAPELPLEEVFFLALLCYLTMNLYRWLGALKLGAKAISGLRRDASADARPGRRDP